MYQGKRVRLRALERADLPVFMCIRNDYEAMRTWSSGALYPVTQEDALRFVDQQSASTGGEYHFAIESLEGNAFVGFCGACRVDWKNRWAEVSIAVAQGQQGKGYGTDAMVLLLAFIFGELNLERVRLDVLALNGAAVRCYEKAGFVREGVRRQEVFREGGYHDLIQMGILRQEHTQWLLHGYTPHA